MSVLYLVETHGIVSLCIFATYEGIFKFWQLQVTNPITKMDDIRMEHLQIDHMSCKGENIF
jgi:hypothetical protein